MRVIIGKRGLDLIKDYEKLSLKAFKPIPTDPFTIGWGRAYGVKEGDTCTPLQADNMLMDDLGWVQSALQAVTVPLSQNMYDALCSWVYNVGKGAFTDSTLLRELNKGHYWNIPDQLRLWNKSKGVVYQGLVNRRQVEVELFTTPDAANG